MRINDKYNDKIYKKVIDTTTIYFFIYSLIVIEATTILFIKNRFQTYIIINNV